jgi:hypothetical protein
VPRILRSKEEEDSSGGECEGEEQGELEEKTGTPRDEFVQNPEEQRAKAEQRRQQQMQSRARSRRGPGPENRDVVGVWTLIIFEIYYILRYCSDSLLKLKKKSKLRFLSPRANYID